MNILQKFSILKFSAQSALKHKVLIFSILLLVLITTFIAAVLIGASDMDILKALFSGEKESVDYRIFMYVRLPRAISAILAGAALAVSGVIIQAVLNNAMAAPNIIGVNSGAGFFVILTLALFPTALYLVPIAAFVGAFLTCIFIFAIAKKTGASRMTITLVGIAVSSILNSCINMIKTVFPDSIYNFTAFSVGGLSGVDFSSIQIPALLIFAGIIIAIIFAKDIDILILGEMSAKSLGMNVSFIRFVLLVTASILAGSAVSFSGLLGFVGLVIPHIVRRFIGQRHTYLIPICAISGAELVLLCDILSRVLFAPYEIPVGILLSFIGGFFFISLLLTQRKSKII